MPAKLRTKKKKVNRTDLTLRNLHALEKKFRILGNAILNIEQRVQWLERNWMVSRVTGSRLREITTPKPEPIKLGKSKSKKR